MDFRKLLHSLAPVVAVAMAASVAGCHADVHINDEQGRPLSDLDLSAPAPHSLVLLGPDRVVVTAGDKLAISVEGDASVTEHLRFTLKDGTLGILRDHSIWGVGVDRSATVHVTMPAPDELVMTGSGMIEAGQVAPKAKVTIAGSGRVHTPHLTADSLEVTIAGSGDYSAEGAAKSLSLTIAGSGSAEMAGLKVDTADISITGSGRSRFASDGTVSANILGSGNVQVKGRARCSVSAMGSGKLVCEP